MQRARRILLGVVPALLLSGCLSPTLPLPPPDSPDEIEQTGQGQYRLTGSIPSPGTVLVLDTRSNLVFGKIVSGPYVLDVEAKPGDLMSLWYESGGDTSDGVDFRIPILADQAPKDAGTD